MLKHIDYDLTFSNGQNRKLATDLQHGSTMITGRNGRGKSLLLEMFAFALFGAKALRGVASDYKKIDVTVTVNIRGKDYVISRTKTKAQIGYPESDEPMATTTTPVNQFIEQLLGYNYDVFRITNWCAQGDIQALANMKPTERKAMIDTVAGLTQLDGLLEMVKNDIKTYKTSINAVEQAVSKPIAPLRPETNEEDLIQARDKAQHLQNEYQRLSRAVGEYRFLQTPVAPIYPQLRQIPTTPPQDKLLPEYVQEALAPFTLTAPVKPTVMGEMSYDDMVTRCRAIWDDLTAKRNAVVQLKQELDRCSAIPTDLQEVLEHTSIDFWKERNTVWQQKLAYDSLLAQGEVTCPNCKHKHPVASEALANFDTNSFPTEKPYSVREMEAFYKTIEVANNLYYAEQDLLSIFGDEQAQNDAFARLDQIKAELQSWKKAEQDYERAKAEYDIRAQGLESLNQQRKKHWEQQVQEITQFNKDQRFVFEKNCLELEQRNQQDLAQYKTATEQYNVVLAEYQDNVELRDKLQTELQTLQESGDYKLSSDRIIACNEVLNQWSTYRALYKQYETQLASYNQAMSRVDGERAQLEDLTKAQAALVELKARVKTYIIPSLNKVASYLLSEMTGGEHNSITIDEDFEVYVDTQPLRTMSGSGKDIANLSIRIALGRILTHKVLGMVMLDEIDQGMDESRASYTWECIEKITPQIGQVLQVSHKELRAENRLVIQ